jgi:predicted transcriptional regulator
MNAELFGKSQADKLAEENNTARKIVKEINQYGISERQRWLVMYYLALEIEDVEKMQEITSMLKELNSDMNISSIYEKGSLSHG